MIWKGVMPAMTTAMNPDFSLDLSSITKRAKWLIDSGCTGIVALGSLGESPTLSHAEKRTVLETIRSAVDAPLVAVFALVALASACGRRATHADCQLIVDRSVEVQLSEPVSRCRPARD